MNTDPDVVRDMTEHAVWQLAVDLDHPISAIPIEAAIRNLRDLLDDVKEHLGVDFFRPAFEEDDESDEDEEEPDEEENKSDEEDDYESYYSEEEYCCD